MVHSYLIAQKLQVSARINFVQKAVMMEQQESNQNLKRGP